MAWIEKLSEDQDESGTLARVYSASKSRAGEVAQILQVMSPRPDLLEKFIDLYVQLMQHSSGLSRAEREWVAVLTSQHLPPILRPSRALFKSRSGVQQSSDRGHGVNSVWFRRKPEASRTPDRLPEHRRHD